LTFNVRDFVALHAQYLAEKRDHAGIIVSTQLLLPELLRRTLNLLNVLAVRRCETVSNSSTTISKARITIFKNKWQVSA
jgi:hypothetical protein